MHPGADTGTGHPVVLLLKRPRRVDQHLRPDGTQCGGTDIARIEAGGRDARLGLPRQPRREAFRPRPAAAGDDHLDAGDPRQPLGGEPPEGAVAAEDEDALQSFTSLSKKSDSE